MSFAHLDNLKKANDEKKNKTKKKTALELQ